MWVGRWMERQAYNRISGPISDVEIYHNRPELVDVQTSMFHIDKQCFFRVNAWKRSVNRHLETGVNMIPLPYRIVLSAFKKGVVGTKPRDDV